jgi:periplasmic protein TonB
MDAHPRRRQLLAVLAVALLHAGLLALLLAPMRLVTPPQPEAMSVFDIPAPPPAPAADPPEAQLPEAPEAEARVAPPARKAEPRPVAAPVEPQPTPADVAPVPADGPETLSGAASSGPGTGATGQGPGTGAAAQGTGQGGGGEGSTRPRWKSGRIDRRDYPPEAAGANIGGSVTAHFDVDAQGRVSGCIVVRSSGNPALDRTTCRLIEQRFRYHPALDGAGNPRPDVAGWRQDWWLDPPR